MSFTGSPKLAIWLVTCMLLLSFGAGVVNCRLRGGLWCEDVYDVWCTVLKQSLAGQNAVWSTHILCPKLHPKRGPKDVSPPSHTFERRFSPLITALFLVVLFRSALFSDVFCSVCLLSELLSRLSLPRFRFGSIVFSWGNTSATRTDWC